jgi:hypothetical protein
MPIYSFVNSPRKRPRLRTGRMQTNSQYHLLPGNQQVKGINLAHPTPLDVEYITANPDTVWADMWQSWQWDVIKARIDKCVAAGANTVRQMGSTQAVLGEFITREQYLARWSQLIDYCASVGLYVYACGGDGYTSPGYDNFSVYSVSMPTELVAELAALGALLQTKTNVMGFDVWNENPLSSLRSTAAAAVRAVTDIPITFSTFQTSIGDKSYHASIDDDVDYFDHHIYLYSRVTDINGYWGSGEDKPLLIGEFGRQVSDGDVSTRFAQVRTTVETALSGGRVVAGALVWQIQDYSAETYGLYDADGNVKADHYNGWNALPSTFAASDTSVVSDSFNRANDGSGLGTADSGQTWTNRVGVLGVNSNRCYPQTLVGDTALATIESGMTDVVAKITPVTYVTVGRFIGVVARYQDASNYYLAQSDGVKTQLYKRLAGTYTQLGSDAAALSANNVLELRCQGSAISLWANGVQLVSVTDTSLTSGTQVGIIVGGFSDATSLRMDSFSAVAAT